MVFKNNIVTMGLLMALLLLGGCEDRAQGVSDFPCHLNVNSECDRDGDGIIDKDDEAEFDPCVPVQKAGYRGYDNNNTAWQNANCDGDDYTNGEEDNIALTPKNYLSDPYDVSSACFMFKFLKYCEINTKDNKKWLDRNLGANKACQNPTDRSCYGDFYQWGRNSDGHEKRGSQRTQDINPKVFPYSSDSFELASSGRFDWLTSDGSEATAGVVTERKKRWSDSNNNAICPKGWYVPGKNEISAVLGAENIYDTNSAFTSLLKLPKAGYRAAGNGDIFQENNTGYLWSTDVAAGDKSTALTYTNGNLFWSESYRATGYSIRCIKK